ncbi:hypothetical protein E2C01_066151 [Portunus trituberculatus]|uniref:Uncharacterized protein n=1 Tax=Portunus trituberculatus TaxID=210409 RepID=A0A5B7HKR2_PORTR|nr:hypothetical protein [Portunus trituberculatus]
MATSFECLRRGRRSCAREGREGGGVGLGGGQTTRSNGQCHFHILLTFPPSMQGHTFTNTNNVNMTRAESTLCRSGARGWGGGVAGGAWVISFPDLSSHELREEPEL